MYYGFVYVDMWCGVIVGKNIKLVDDLLCDIVMQIVVCGNWYIGIDDGMGSGNLVVFCIFYVFDVYCVMYCEIEFVNGQGSFQLFQKFCFEGFIGVVCNWIVRYGVGMQQGQMFQFFIFEKVEIVGSQKIVFVQNLEVFGLY